MTKCNGQHNSVDELVSCSDCRAALDAMEMLSIYKVRDLVRSFGIVCEVIHTGGGCHTIYAGPTWEAEPGYFESCILAGPSGPEAFYPADLCIGWGFDDDHTEYPHHTTEEEWAQCIVRWVRFVQDLMVTQ